MTKDQLFEWLMECPKGALPRKVGVHTSVTQPYKQGKTFFQILLWDGMLNTHVGSGLTRVEALASIEELDRDDEKRLMRQLTKHGLQG